MLKLPLSALMLTTACMCGPALAATEPGKSSEAAQAAQARSKPLQRCDQLSGKAELACLHKARERIVDARRKREASGKGEERALTPTDDKAGAAKPAPVAKKDDAKK